MVEGNRCFFAHVYIRFTKYARYSYPRFERFQVFQRFVRCKFEVDVSAGAVWACRSVSSYEVVSVYCKEVAFYYYRFIFIVFEVHVPVINLCHVVRISDSYIYIVFVEVLSVGCNVIFYIEFRKSLLIFDVFFFERYYRFVRKCLLLWRYFGGGGVSGDAELSDSHPAIQIISELKHKAMIFLFIIHVPSLFLFPLR